MRAHRVIRQSQAFFLAAAAFERSALSFWSFSALAFEIALAPTQSGILGVRALCAWDVAC
jgi:hypothetical protein